MHSSSSKPLAAALLLVVSYASAAEDYAPYPQPDAGYVTDHANVLSAEQEERIEQSLHGVELKSGTEIIVMTIQSIRDYAGTENSTIESFATALFNRYGIGNMPANDGILLLVAIRDRKVRIELGGGYTPDRDADAAKIVANEILPEFRAEEYARGITRGVKAIVNEFTSTRIGIPWQMMLIPAVIVILVFTAVSLIMSGKRGWGWVLLGLALVLILGLIVMLIAVSRALPQQKSSGWSPGGAGGFGGGSSRGGGATGSW